MTKDFNIVLTGFMGTGKSTIGKMLARRLGYRFVDTDHVIESRAGCSVAEIFEQHGEEVFREQETKVAEELSEQNRLVIATGGGMLVNSENQRILESTGKIFCLTANIDEIIKRLSNPRARAQRPLLKTENLKQHVKEMLEKRRSTYTKFVQINTSGKTTREAVDAILKIVRNMQAVENQ